jgi:mRNA interferase MazF
MNPNLTIKRGDVWEVDPSEGDEIRKIRPAVVMSANGVGRLQLRIVVPITGWQDRFSQFFWLVRLPASSGTGLRKESAADTIQIKSVSVLRFRSKLGELDPRLLDRIARAIAICIDHRG